MSSDEQPEAGTFEAQPDTMAEPDVPARSLGADRPQTLREAVEDCMERYFEQLDGDSTTNLYELVMNEVEAPLLEAVLRHTGSNQSRASIILGVNRGTLRKKMKQHGLL